MWLRLINAITYILLLIAGVCMFNDKIHLVVQLPKDFILQYLCYIGLVITIFVGIVTLVSPAFLILYWKNKEIN